MKPDIKWIGSPNYGYPRGTAGRNGYKVIAIVNHIMAGTLAGTNSWFNNLSSKASAHFGVGKNGKINQYVDIANAAWHAGDVNNPDWVLLKEDVNPNWYTVGIEHEGYPGDEMPEEQFQATLSLQKWLIEELEIIPSEDTIIGHYRINSIQRANCPGPTFPWDRLYRELESGPFKDISGNHWAAGSVKAVTAAGIISGYPDGTFRGDKAATRYELAAAIEKLMRYSK